MKVEKSEKAVRILVAVNVLLFVIACVVASGCRTVSVENDGEGKGWSVSVMSNMMKSEADTVKAEVRPDGTIAFEMGGMKSSPSEEFYRSLTVFTDMMKLAAAAYNPAASGVSTGVATVQPGATVIAVPATTNATASAESSGK